MRDITSNFTSISKPTYYSYLNALKSLFILEDLKGWTPKIKSKSSMHSGNKKVFIDPSIPVATLDMNPEKFNTLEGLKTFDFIFKNLCIRDLSVYTSRLGGKIYYYPDSSDLEIDCVIHLRDGRYALVNCEFTNNTEEAVENLIKVNKLIEKNNKIEKPSFLAVLTGGEMAYTRKDGVKVIPIGCLR